MNNFLQKNCYFFIYIVIQILDQKVKKGSKRKIKKEKNLQIKGLGIYRVCVLYIFFRMI